MEYQVFQKQQKELSDALGKAGKIDSRLSLWRSLAFVGAVLALAAGTCRRGIYISILPACVLGILTPGWLIDLCMMSTMRCRAVMRPAMIILFSAMLVLSGIGAATSRKD